MQKGFVTRVTTLHISRYVKLLNALEISDNIRRLFVPRIMVIETRHYKFWITDRIKFYISESDIV